ncbi:MAG TPA: hypothetical protein VFG78_01945 [Gemmatimonadota bacterium]|nr:hypothetical protein [Gemmatimonadota bacterium]
MKTLADGPGDTARKVAKELRFGARVLWSLPGYLRIPLSPEQCRAELASRLANRESRFLQQLDRWVFTRPAHPYARLFAHAGYDRTEVSRLLEAEGLEGALSVLLRSGVYLTCDEFKGRVPVCRGSLAFRIGPCELIRPDAVVHGVSRSSGSRGHATAVPIDSAFIRDHAVNTHLGLEAHGGGGWVHAHWGVPGGTSVTNTLELAKGGVPPARWFTPVSVDERGLHSRYRVGGLAMRLAGRMAGVRLPGPTLATLEDPEPVVRWIRGVLDAGGIPHVWGFASTAVFVCEAARSVGVDVTGARFTMGGEPTTVARRRAVEDAGAVPLPRFGATETDIIAFACRSPEASDDQHFFHDRHALVQAEESDADRIPAGTLLLTSLLDSAPVLLLNVSLGDRARLSRRACGCPMERFGWPLHVQRIRSYEKLTAGGMTFLDVDVIRVLEETLPTRFGGKPTDYQLLERANGPAGRPQLRLRVHPRVGPLNDREVVDAFLDAIGGGDSGERLMELQWRKSGMVVLEREAPARTESGKILHLHAS